MKIEVFYIIVLKIVLAVIAVILTLNSVYFFITSLFGFKKSTPFSHSDVKHRFCAVVAARNEEKVISNIIASLKNQDYPADMLDIFVVINNCTDNTRQIALSCGAKVYDCLEKINCKGDALKEFFGAGIYKNYDAICVFDADNLVAENFISAMNDAFSSGCRLAQGYCESINSSDSWVSGCYSIYFGIINRFINIARQNIGLSAYIVGTGFMMSSDYLDQFGFETKTLTEDLENTIQSIINGQKVAFADEAVIYCEHPTEFKVSWFQRKRWSTGMIQCFKKYGAGLFKGIFSKHSAKCADAFLYLTVPIIQFLTVISVLISLILAVNNWFGLLIMAGFLIFYFVALSVFSICIIKIGKYSIKNMGCKAAFLMWFFIISWTAINTVCIFMPEKGWKPIKHFGKNKD